MINRYIVERTFADGLTLPISAEGEAACARIGATNADLNVTWVQSFVNEEKTKTYCVYDAPSPEAIRQVAERNGLPIDSITKVSVLDPHFYR